MGRRHLVVPGAVLVAVVIASGFLGVVVGGALLFVGVIRY